MVKTSKDIFVIDRVGNKKRKKNEEKHEDDAKVDDSAEEIEEQEQVKPARKDKKQAEKGDKSNKKAAKKTNPNQDSEGDDPVATNEDIVDENTENEKPKKKKKKSKGEGEESEQPKNVGTKRGTEAGRLDEATLPYVREVTSLAKADDFETDEDRSIFVDNVWRELKMGNTDQLVRLITHKEGSVAVQSLLALSAPRQLYRFCRGLKGVMPRVIFNPYGSHVLEALFGYIPRLVNASMDDFKQAEEDGEEDGGAAGEDLETLEKLFQDTCACPTPFACSGRSLIPFIPSTSLSRALSFSFLLPCSTLLPLIQPRSSPLPSQPKIPRHTLTYADRACCAQAHAYAYMHMPASVHTYILRICCIQAVRTCCAYSLDMRQTNSRAHAHTQQFY
jgi:hypothetical protein